jgi:iron-sulfur cluster repair protein YtfE (RIC family)
MSIDNSKIRRIVLVEHEGLRIGLRSIDALLDKVTKGDVVALKDAHSQFTQLLDAFVRHIEHEERILRPVLATIDAWGKARVDSMDEEHAAQRKEVTRLAGLDAISDPARWAKEVRAFEASLLADMADEEKTCLSPDVLRDDIIAVHVDSSE